MTLLMFGEFRLDRTNKQLYRGDRLVELSGLPLQVLCHFVEHSAEEPDDGDRLFTKQALRDQIWRAVHVSDETLRGCILTIRKALDDDPQQPRYIKTQSKEGWRFLMKVRAQLTAAPPPRTPQPPNGPYDPDWYIERPREERELLSCLNHPGRPAVLCGPQGCGKSTLIARAIASVGAAPSERRPRLIRISLRALGQAHPDSLDGMLQDFGRLLLDADPENDACPQDWMTKLWRPGIDAKLNLKKLLRTQVLAPDRLVYLVLSDVDCLAPWRFQAAWFDMLRAWQDAEALASLRLVLETAIPPRLFPLSGQSPFWTKVRRIHVPPLEASQIEQMAALYELRPAKTACQELGELIGGLAGLSRHALYQAAVREVPLEALLREYHPERRAFGVFTEHLEDLQQWYEQKGADESQSILREAGQGVSLSTERAWPLVRKGLLVETETRNVYRLRCRLYADFFAERGR